MSLEKNKSNMIIFLNRKSLMHNSLLIILEDKYLTFVNFDFMAEETKPIVTLQDARLFDSYNSAEARKFETQAGTLRNGRVFIAPSTFQLGTKVTKATTFSMKRKTKLAPSNLNLGLFAAVSFKENAIISFYGGDYLIRSLCNKNPPILKKLNASNHLALVNKHRIVVGDNVAQFMDRDTVIDDSKQSRRAKEYYMYDKLPEDLKERFVDEEAYKEYRTMLMDLGAGKPYICTSNLPSNLY